MFSLLHHLRIARYRMLPRVPAVTDERMRDYCLIVGGLALLLSRCPRTVVEKRFRSASQLHAELVRVLRGGDVNLSRELVCEVSHEVAEFTDRVTRDALLRRMRCI